MKSSKTEVSKWVNTFSMTKFFVMKWKTRKKEKGLFVQKKGDSKHRNNLAKNVVFEKERRVCKRRKKGRNRIIKSKRIFKKKRYIQKGQQKRNHTKNRCSRKRTKKENVKKHKRIHTQKKEKWKKKKTERNDEHAKTYKFVKMSNNKVKSFWKCRSVKYVFQKQVIDRDNKKRKKRQQMNKWMNKRRT